MELLGDATEENMLIAEGCIPGPLKRLWSRFLRKIGLKKKRNVQETPSTHTPQIPRTQTGQTPPPIFTDVASLLTNGMQQMGKDLKKEGQMAQLKLNEIQHDLRGAASNLKTEVVKDLRGAASILKTEVEQDLHAVQSNIREAESDIREAEFVIQGLFEELANVAQGFDNASFGTAFAHGLKEGLENEFPSRVSFESQTSISW